MRLGLWLRFALRELRSGLRGFWIFLLCLTLGTSSIAMIGALSASIMRGLHEQGQQLLGGDVELALIHREASPAQYEAFAAQGQTSAIATTKAMATGPNSATLIEIKAIDDAYPLYGPLEVTPSITKADVFMERGNSYGIAIDPLLSARLGVGLGDHIRIGNQSFVINANIVSEPDRLSDGFLLGPRVIMSRAALQASGLVQPGSLITYRYRIKLPAHANADDRIARLNSAFPDAGWQSRSRDKAARGTENFISRLTYFLTLVGLTALIVGGTGIANAVSAFIDHHTQTMATLKCLGASGRDVFAIYFIEILLVAGCGVIFSLALGALTPWAAQVTLQSLIPLPLSSSIEWQPLGLTLLLGLLATAGFSMWPLARIQNISPASLFRHRSATAQGWPRWPYLLGIAICFAAMAALVFASFDNARMTAMYLGGLLVSFIVLLGLAWAIVALVRLAPKPRNTLWRYALSNICRPASAAISVILALGLGLTLFVNLAVTDKTIANELQGDLIKSAPAFFFLDVKAADLAGFKAMLKATPGVTAVQDAPMLRGRIVKIGDTPAEKVTVNGEGGWALRGDRGLTYAETLPEGSKLTDGQWWSADYAGPPLVSVVDEIAHGIGLNIGDQITVNVLGRDIVATVANFRQVNWRSLSINFVMVFSPNTLKNAPHSSLVTVNMTGGDEAKLLNDTARDWPTISAIRVKETLATITSLLGQMLTAIRAANLLTLLTGILVLAGALAAGPSLRSYEAVILKTCGASKAQLMTAFVIEYAMLGLAAATFGMFAGSVGSWFLARHVLEMPWQMSPLIAIGTALLAMLGSVLAGLMVTWRALSIKPSPTLHNE